VSTMIQTCGDGLQYSTCNDPTSVTVPVGQMSISGSQVIVFADVEAISEVGVRVGTRVPASGSERDSIEEHKGLR
jgi:hypothetical protein